MRMGGFTTLGSVPCPSPRCPAAPRQALTAAAAPPCPACHPATGSPVVPGKDSAAHAELALQSYKINPVCKEHMPGMAWAHPHQ